jgi:hypothetical protein
MATSASLCDACALRRVIVSGTGSRFLLCQKSLEDKHFPKYPPQPVLRCAGFVFSRSPESESGAE